MNHDRIVRAALTQCHNAYSGMPERVEDLPRLASVLDEIRQANVDHHVALMEEARTLGVDVIGFGELFTAPYFALHQDPFWTGLAENAEYGPTVTTLRAAAAHLGLVVIAPIYERAPDGRRFNTAVLIDETGQLLGRFRKVHLPHGHNEQGSFLEGDYYERSDGQNGPFHGNISHNPHFPVWETRAGRIGVATCYDRHFEGVMSALAHEGAQIVFSPAVTFGEKSRRMWDMEFAVDAARHNLFIAGSNRLGAEAPWNQEFFGGSHFVGPQGALANVSNRHELIVADLDLGDLERPDPSGWNLARDRRPECYRRP